MPFKLPVMSFDDVRIRTKLWIVVAVLVLPIVVLMVMQFRSLQDSVNRADTERAGVEFEIAALDLVRNLQLHRDHEIRVLRGNSGSQPSLDQAAAAIDESFIRLRELAGAAGVNDEVVRLHVDWQTFKDQTRPTTAESFDAHTKFINESTIPVLLTAATRSELFTDSEVASRAVIESLMVSLNLGEQVAQARVLGYAGLLDRAGLEPTAEDRATIGKYLNSAEVYAQQLRFQLEQAMAADESLVATVEPLLERQEGTLLTFSSFANSNFVNATTLESIRAESFYVLGTAAVNASNELVTAAASAMDAEFQSRSSQATEQMRVVGGVALFGIIIALLLVFVVSRSITRPVTHLAEVADRISLGELDVEIDVHGTNEVGQLAESLRRMQASLRSAIERLRQRRAA